MNFLVITVLSACTISVITLEERTRVKRTWLGSHVDISKVNFVVSLEIEHDDKNEICSGIILNPEWILTSATCFSVAPKAINIRYGTNYRNKHGHYLKIEALESNEELGKIINIHPYFAYYVDFHRYDVALIKFNLAKNETIDFVKIEEVNWPVDDMEKPMERLCTVYGFGENIDGDLQLHSSEFIMQYGLSCECFYGSPYGLCTKLTTDNDNDTACYGDWGGPLICSGELVAIFSNLGRCSNRSGPIHCGENDLISAYTYLKPFIPWIRNIVGEEYIPYSDQSDNFSNTDVYPPLIDNAKWEKEVLKRKENRLAMEIKLWENSKEQWDEISKEMDKKKEQWEQNVEDLETKKAKWENQQKLLEESLVDMRVNDIVNKEKTRLKFEDMKEELDQAKKDWEEEKIQWEQKRLDWQRHRQRLEQERSDISKRLKTLYEKASGNVIRAVTARSESSTVAFCKPFVFLLSSLPLIIHF